MYSTIKRKTCKCGCNKYPTVGYNGFYSSHAPKEILDKVGTKRQVAKRNRSARLAVSRKLRAEQPEIKEDKELKELWFRAIRQKLVGTCQCGCGQSSSKKDDTYFRHSCCHLFPKKDFHSIKYHPLNYIERAFFGGCHTNLDEQGMDKWVNMADWQDIREKFFILAPLLTKEEMAMKFYARLEKLVFNNPI